MRYFLRFAYDGTAFHGSQRQPNGVTVQETMEQALAMIFREEVPLTFAGRTDAGVHAREMYAHFDLPNNQYPIGAAPSNSPIGRPIPQNLVFRLNGILPDSIAVFDVYPVRMMRMHVSMQCVVHTNIISLITKTLSFVHKPRVYAQD